MTSASAKRSTHALGTTLSSILVLLLGVGLVPASASAAQAPAAGVQNTAQGPAAAFQNAVQSPTRLLGFNRTPASVRVGGQVADSVTVSPPGSRTVYVQYRRAGTTRFTTAYREKTSRQGSFTAYLMPRSAGTWQFRLVVVAATRAKGVVSPLRTVRASGRATTTRIIGFASTPTTITVGTTVRDAVSVSPRASRTVEVQARRAATTTWVRTSTSGRSSAAGNFVATYRPAVGVWQYRLVVRASATARTAVSATRTVTARRSAPSAPAADTTAPRPVTALTATVLTDTSIRLNWTNPTNTDFTGVTIRRADGGIAPGTRSAGTAVTGGVATASSYIDTGLTAGNQYSYAVFAHDAALNHAVAATWTGRTTITIAPDTTAPGPVTALSASVTDSSIRLSWTNPTATDFTGVTIRRAAGPDAPATVTAGTAVTGGVATASSYTDSDLTAVTQYSYAVFAHDGDANHAPGATWTGWTNGTPPGPTAALLSIRLPFGIDTTKLTVGKNFDFDATASFASTGKTLSSATLDYGDGTSLTFPGDSWTWVGSHRYTTNGPKDVTLTVTDSAGDTVSYEVTITVYGRPTASIATSDSAQASAPVTFKLTYITPPGTEITSYVLNVEGADGTTEYGSNGSPPATRDITFPSPGTYRVQFSVSNDAKGSSAMDSLTIKVAGATTTAVLSASAEGVDTTSITAGGSLFFVASDSYAGPAGVTLASVKLDFGDGTAVRVFNEDQASWFETHPFVAAGTYPVKLTVTDSAHVTVTNVVTVTVSTAPTARISIEDDQTPVRVGVPVTFTLTSSTPPGTAITSWTVGGDWWDGDYGTPPPATVDHTFNREGTYTVQFEVGNDALGTAQSSLEVTVLP